MNNLMYIVLNAVFRAILQTINAYIVVNALLLVMCVIRPSVDGAIL